MCEPWGSGAGRLSHQATTLNPKALQWGYRPVHRRSRMRIADGSRGDLRIRRPCHERHDALEWPSKDISIESRRAFGIADWRPHSAVRAKPGGGAWIGSCLGVVPSSFQARSASCTSAGGTRSFEASKALCGWDNKTIVPHNKTVVEFSGAPSERHCPSGLRSERTR